MDHIKRNYSLYYDPFGEHNKSNELDADIYTKIKDKYEDLIVSLNIRPTDAFETKNEKILGNDISYFFTVHTAIIIDNKNNLPNKTDFIREYFEFLKRGYKLIRIYHEFNDVNFENKIDFIRNCLINKDERKMYLYPRMTYAVLLRCPQLTMIDYSQGDLNNRQYLKLGDPEMSESKNEVLLKKLGATVDRNIDKDL